MSYITQFQRCCLSSISKYLPLLLIVALTLSGCDFSGDTGTSPNIPDSGDTQFFRQGVMEVLRAYRVAFIQEDIDRLQELFLSEDEGDLEDSRLFLRAMTEAFRTRTVIDLEIPTEEIRIVSDSQSVSFLEVETIDEPVTMMRLTRAFRTNMWLEPREEPGGIVSFRIAGIKRDGPVMQVTTPGQVVAGIPARIKVAELTGSLRINEVTVQEVEGGPESRLAIVDNFFQGIFTPRAELQPLRIHIQGNRGEEISLQHQYRLRQADEWMVQQIGGTSIDARFFAVAAAPNGTIWAGGNNDRAYFNSGLLYQVPSGSITVSASHDFPGTLREGPHGVRIEDLVIDQLERLHIVMASSTTSRVLVHNEDIFCQTVDIFDSAYPFHDLQGEPSASLRALAAGDGDIWLFGSDGGVARVTDMFREGNCPGNGVQVQYQDFFRRQESTENSLISNTVPALVASVDGALWFGTIFGLIRFQDEKFTPVLFRRTLDLDRVKTLEEYFRDVAQALFDARPLTTVTIGGDGDDGVSFIELFGRPLIKEDIILSAVEDSQGRIWVGTLGGGIRRVEFYRGRWQDGLHITRTGVVRTESDTNRPNIISHSGIGGNIIFSLAVGPDNSVWAATEKGVSRIQVGDEDVVISNFSTLDGLEAPAFTLSGNASLLWVLLEQFRDAPVRDIVVDREGIAWAVKNAGLFQISPQGWQLQGRVLDTTDSSVIGADITVLREIEIDNFPFPRTVALHTPFQTITDTNGIFIINGLPTGQVRLQVNGKSATNGSFTVQEMHVEVPGDVQGIEFRLNLDSDGDGVGDEDEMVHGTDHKRLDTDEGGQTDGVEIETDGTNPLDPHDDLVRNGPVDVSITKENTGAMIISGRSALYINASTGRRAMISGCSTVDIGRSLNGTAFPLDCTGASVGRGPHFAAPTGIAQEHAGSFVVSNRGGFRGAPPGATVMRVDPQNGARSLVSGCIDHPACTSIVGHGPLFGSPEDIAVEPTGALVVVDSDRRAVVRVDPLTGDRTIVSDDSHGGGIQFGFPEDIAVESTGTLVVVDRIRGGVVRATVVRVDPLTGDRTIVSDDSHGGGIPFSSLYLEDIAVESTGTLVVVDSDRRAVVRVDPLTGDRTIVSDDEHGDGSAFVSPQAIGVESAGTLLVADASTTLGKGELVIVRVDPLTGDRTFVDFNNSP